MGILFNNNNNYNSLGIFYRESSLYELALKTSKNINYLLQVLNFVCMVREVLLSKLVLRHSHVIIFCYYNNIIFILLLCSERNEELFVGISTS